MDVGFRIIRPIFNYVEILHPIQDGGFSIALNMVLGLVSGVVSGLIVWRITTCVMRRWELEAGFKREQQQLERDLENMRVLLEDPVNDDELKLLKILVNTLPAREYFTLDNVNAAQEFNEACGVIDGLEQFANGNCLDDEKRVRLCSDLYKARVSLLKMKVKTCRFCKKIKN